MHKKEKTETKPDLYIPSFPDPVDKNGEYILKTNDDYTEVIMPYWYWLQICKYATDVESYAQSIQAD